MDAPRQLTSTEFQQFQQLIYDMCGIRVPDTKRVLLSNRVRTRLKAGGFEGFSAYFSHLNSLSGRRELPHFLDAITTNETAFFRHTPHFDWLRSNFIEEVLEQARCGARRQSLKIWSAACSTGEEPYSIAICLAENALRLRDWELEIVATDLSEEALGVAEQGIYAAAALKNFDEKQQRRHFKQLRDGARWQIRPHLRDLVKFRKHNLMAPPPAAEFDCIFVRNVLIYFDRPSKQRVVKHLIGALAPRGHLVVGPSEGVYDMLDELTKHSTFLYQK